MVNGISSSSASTAVQQTNTVHNVPSPASQGTSSKEDTVQLSAEAQQQLTATKKGSAPAAPQTISEIVKEAADGSIAALAQLALIG